MGALALCEAAKMTAASTPASTLRLLRSLQNMKQKHGLGRSADSR